MESRGKAAAVAAAFAIAAALSACASPGGAVTAATDASPAPHLPPLPPRVPEIKDLAGLQPAEVVSILGPPDLRRNEPPAQLWQYRTADCVLNLFFYREAGDYRLTHAEAWQRGLTGGSVPAPCHDEDAPIKAHLISQSRL